jgi:hypothetical protein
VLYLSFFNHSLCMESHEESPLSVACRTGNDKIVSVLLEFGASPKAPDEYGVTPLHWYTIHFTIVFPPKRFTCQKTGPRIVANQNFSMLFSTRENWDQSIWPKRTSMDQHLFILHQQGIWQRVYRHWYVSPERTFVFMTQCDMHACHRLRLGVIQRL